MCRHPWCTFKAFVNYLLDFYTILCLNALKIYLCQGSKILKKKHNILLEDFYETNLKSISSNQFTFISILLKREKYWLRRTNITTAIEKNLLILCDL